MIKTLNASVQLVWSNPTLWKPQDLKLIWKDFIYTQMLFKLISTLDGLRANAFSFGAAVKNSGGPEVPN